MNDPERQHDPRTHGKPVRHTVTHELELSPSTQAEAIREYLGIGEEWEMPGIRAATIFRTVVEWKELGE